MDIKVFYQKVRQTEASIKEREVVIVSLETPDGGREGVRSEVPRTVAAKLITEGWARLATPEEDRAFREETAEARRVAEQKASASRMQIAVLSESDLKALRSAKKG